MQGDPHCRTLQGRHRGRTTGTRPAAAAVLQDSGFVSAVAASLAHIYGQISKVHSSANVNDSQQYLAYELLDSASNHHITQSSARLHRSAPYTGMLNLADNRSARITRVGTAIHQGLHKPLHLARYLCVPTLRQDLVPAGRLTDTYDVYLKRHKFNVTTPDPNSPASVIAMDTRRGYQFYFDDDVQKADACAANARAVGRMRRSLQRLHDTFGYAHRRALDRLLQRTPQLRNLTTQAKGTYTCAMQCRQVDASTAPLQGQVYDLATRSTQLGHLRASCTLYSRPKLLHTSGGPSHWLLSCHPLPFQE